MRVNSVVLLACAAALTLRADAWSDAIEKLRTGDQEGAIQLLQGAIAKEPAAVRPNVLLAEVLLSSERLSEARKVADDAIAKDPKVADFHRVAGDVRFRQGDILGAEKEYKAAYAMDPKNSRAQLGVARVYQTGSLNRTAELLIYQAHHLDPDDPVIEAALERTERNSPATLARWEEWLKTGPEAGAANSGTRELKAHIEAAKKLGGKPSFELASAYAHYQIPMTILRDGQRFTGVALSISINGAKGDLQLDTGAGGLLISSRMAERGGVQRLADVDLGGIGNMGAKKGWLGYAEQIKIGDLEFRNCIVRVAEKGSVSDSGGLIGTDVLRRFLVKLDFRLHRVELDPLPGPAWDGEKMVDRYSGPELSDYAQFLRLAHYVLVPTRISDGPQVLFMVDTGAGRSMISTNAAPAVTKLRDDPRTRIKGISGDVKMVYSADKVTLEFARFRQVNQDITAFDLSGFSRGAGTEITGIMGLSLLDLFASITLDYRDGRIKFDYKN